MQRRSVVGVMLLGVCALGCSGSDRDGDGPASGAGGTLPPPDGLAAQGGGGGGGTQSLEPGCEPFEAVTPLPFEACGGAPLGLWRIAELRWEASVWTFTRPSPDFLAMTDMLECPTNVSDAEMPQFVLELADGGGGRLHRTQAGHVESHADSCATPFLGEPCSQHLESVTCVRDCDECRCTFRPPPGVAAGSGDIEWSAVGTVLTLSPELNPDESFDFCVSGDELRLSDERGRVFTLRRAFAIENPVRCEDRALEDCELGEIGDRGCRVGACVGAGDCGSATEEADCTNRSGCSWDASTCAGDPGPRCDLGQLNVTPGCELFDVEPRCVGTRTACEDLTADDCAVSPGCSFGQGCEGGAVDCTALSGACSLCTQVDGCVECPTVSTCGGTATCIGQQTQASCEAVGSLGMGSCAWVDDVCRGAASPCDELDLDVCADAVGCRIEVPP